MLWLFRHSFVPKVVRYLSTCLFAPRQKLMFWSHTLKERGIVIFASFQCFVCFKRVLDRQLHLTGRLSLSICTGCTMAFSDRVS